MTEMNDAVAVGRPVAETKKRGGARKPSNGKGRRNLEIFILSAPAIILFCCFVILPIILGAYYGFYQWKGFGTPAENGKFVGLQNYIVALKDPNFQQAILHTFEIVIVFQFLDRNLFTPEGVLTTRTARGPEQQQLVNREIPLVQNF